MTDNQWLLIRQRAFCFLRANCSHTACACVTISYLLCCRASLHVGQYKIILLDVWGRCMWTTCSEP